MPISRRQFGSAVVGAAASALAAPISARPKLLVILTCGQFRPDYLARYHRMLSPGGFRRLIAKGAYFPDCRYLCSTFTSTGIATLATGAWPQVHGAVADSWFDPQRHIPVTASAEYLIGSTIADEMKTAGIGTIILIGSDPNRAGILAGRGATHWIGMDMTGEFRTIRSSTGDLGWADEFARGHSPDKLRGAAWRSVGARPNSPPLRTLTYDQSHPEDFVFLYKASPFALQNQMELLNEAVDRERLGLAPNQTDVVFVEVGALELLGYETGSDGPLMRELVLTLDLLIESTIQRLARQIGENDFTFVFTSAHGSPGRPDPTLRPRLAIPGDAIARAIGQANVKAECYLYPFIYLRQTGDISEARRRAARAALTVPGVAGYYTADGECSHSGAWRKAFENSFHISRSGDVMLAYEPGCVEEFGAERGISYGTFHNYEASVPAIFYGPQFRAGTFEQTVEAIDIAPTICRVMGVPLPSACSGHVLGEALAE